MPAGATIGVCTGWSLSKPRSHVRRRKAAAFWYCCCSWCCESGRRAVHPLTRLFHDTRVASYPSSPGEPRGTGRTGTRGWGGVGSVCKRVFSLAGGFSVTALLSIRWVGSFPKMLAAGSSASPPPQPLESPAGGARLAFVRGPGVRLSPTAVRAEPRLALFFLPCTAHHHCCPLPPTPPAAFQKLKGSDSPAQRPVFLPWHSRPFFPGFPTRK